MYNQSYAGRSTLHPYPPPPHPHAPPPHPLPPPLPHSHSFPAPPSQPSIFQPPPITPSHYRQPTLHYSSSPGTPTMSHTYHDPPSPTSPYSNSPSTSYTHGFHAPRQQPSYMSPALTHQFDGLSTASPLLLQSQTVGGPPIDLTHADESHVTVHEYGPSEGTQGSQISVKCHVHFPPTPPPSDSSTSPEGQPHGSNSRGRAMRLVFGSHPVPTKVHILSQSMSVSGGQICQLSANVPSWQSTGSVGAMGRSNRVPLQLQVLAGGSTIMESILVGEYTYTSISTKGPVFHNYTPSGNPLKRAGEALESHRPSPNQFLHRRAVSNGLKVESPELQQYGQFQQPYVGQGGDSSTYSSPYLQQGPMPAPVAQPYSPSSAQPSLMRATQVITPVPAQSNPYVLAGGNKASLELVGDLDAMSKGWDQDEWVGRRRLVQFWRRQDGTTISAAFRPLSQVEYPQQQQSIIISCIFREDKNACFVTSVDTIYLLEALVGTRFTVEEKNRIRRNLEGFRPITVSKNKAGSEEFFKTIMGFPNPKPRNIEKDVKVFPWEILGQALKKIIGKYSASYPYASGGSAMSTPTLGEQAQLPPAAYPQEPHPASFPGAVLGSGSAPPVLSNSSSNSSSYEAHHYPVMHPQTPQMTHHHSHQSANQSPTDQFGTNSTPSEDKHHEYVNLSPPNQSPYAPTTSNQQGHQRDPSGNYWQPNTGIGIGVGGSSAAQSHDAALPSPAVSSGSYATLPGPGGYPDQPHQLPHVHETSSKQPSSSDLRVMYTGIAQ